MLNDEQITMLTSKFYRVAHLAFWHGVRTQQEGPDKLEKRLEAKEDFRNGMVDIMAYLHSLHESFAKEDEE